MQDAAAPAPSERGWGKSLLGLGVFLVVPVLPRMRALLPVEETLVLLLPAIAACCLVGWWAGGRLLLPVVWVALATWVLSQPAVPGSFYNLVRGWSLLLAGGFGMVGLFLPRLPFLSRGLTTLTLAFLLVMRLGLLGPLIPSRLKLAMQGETMRRNTD